MFIAHRVAVRIRPRDQAPPIHLCGCDDGVDFFLVVRAT